MSRGSYTLSVDRDLAQRLKKVDNSWLEDRLESLADEYESREGGAELAPYDSQDEIREDSSISEAETRRRLMKWRRTIGSRRR